MDRKPLASDDGLTATINITKPAIFFKRVRIKSGSGVIKMQNDIKVMFVYIVNNKNNRIKSFTSKDIDMKTKQIAN